MKYSTTPLVLAMSAHLIVSAAFAQEADLNQKGASPLVMSETISMPFQALSVQIQTGLDYANRNAFAPTADTITGGLTLIKEGAIETSSALVSGISNAYNGVVQVVLDLPDLPSRAARAFVGNIRGEQSETFRDLVYKSGFALADVRAGVELLPSFSIYFEHERDLSEEEREEIRHEIDAYIKDHENNVGYVEAVILRSLVRVGRYSGEIDLKGVEISFLPLPGLALIFDPIGVLEREEARNEKAAMDGARALELEAEIEARLDQIEADLSSLMGTMVPSSEASGTALE